MYGGTILRFHCRTTSPFHTTRQRYANLVKCAPFVLGSTLRGALLDALVRTRCPPDRLAHLGAMDDPVAIAKKHRTCTEDCPVRPFFAQPPLARFSFAEFEVERKKMDYRMMTRIGLSRDTYSVAEGSIFTIEAVSPGTPFHFDILLLDHAQDVLDATVGAVRHIAEHGGIGGFRSIGLGRFELVGEGEPDRTSLDECLDRAILGLPRPGDRTRLAFTTPFVLGLEEVAEMVDGEAMARRIEGLVDHAAAQADYTAEGVLPLEQVDVRIQPDFVSRFSFERGLRENRLVAWPGSSLHFDWPTGADEDGVALALTFGIGDWAEWGFGRFEVQAERA